MRLSSELHLFPSSCVCSPNAPEKMCCQATMVMELDRSGERWWAESCSTVVVFTAKVLVSETLVKQCSSES